VREIERKGFKNSTDREIAVDVWMRRVDGLTTQDVASRYGISRQKALKILKQIQAGEIWHPDYPFGLFDEFMSGVEVCDGSTFTHGDSAEYMEGKRGASNHYVWFCN
jgi:hypothetical protein